MKKEIREKIGRYLVISVVFISGIGIIISKYQEHKQNVYFNNSLHKEFKVKIIKIIDGDTIKVEFENGTIEKIRIFGIDTPEKYYTYKLYYDAKKCNVSPKEISQLGKLASNEAKQIFANKTNVYLYSYSKDKYGRIIGKIFIPYNGTKIDYGKLILGKGYSCVYWKNTTKSYIFLMEKAKSKHIGLWKNYYNLMDCLCSQKVNK